MKIHRWRSTVVDALREHIGPLAPVLVDDVIAETPFAPHTREMDDITQFLKNLREELPSCIDASKFILDLNRSLILNSSHQR